MCKDAIYRVSTHISSLCQLNPNSVRCAVNFRFKIYL